MTYMLVLLSNKHQPTKWYIAALKLSIVNMMFNVLQYSYNLSMANIYIYIYISINDIEMVETVYQLAWYK